VQNNYQPQFRYVKPSLVAAASYRLQHSSSSSSSSRSLVYVQDELYSLLPHIWLTTQNVKGYEPSFQVYAGAAVEG